ncbi:hypothetical protein KIW84_032418 [Lathyrus oleraceus]|uniref:Ubiquitin-like protease family profile domain-containing protein n=1 Tax=Pisum sativum TaxID=3888 RepID=A0A9D5B1U3_PEA|nr:hypothetical protein KIW84_032418 [Pisum sativum]
MEEEDVATMNNKAYNKVHLQISIYYKLEMHELKQYFMSLKFSATDLNFPANIVETNKSFYTTLVSHYFAKEEALTSQVPVDNTPAPSPNNVFAQGSQQLSQKIGSRQKNKRDLPVTSLPKKGAFVPRYQISLETLVDSSDMATAGAIRLLDMEEDIFGYSCTETIGKEDLEHIFRHQELGVGVIHTYIRFLYDNFMRGNDQLSNRFRFVSSSLVNKALICREPDSCREYLVKRFMASSTNNLYLWPYNSGCHWLLLVIDPLKEVVYFLNSIDGEWTNYPDMKQLVDTSIKVFRSQRQARVPRTKSSNITWIKVVLYSATVSIADTFTLMNTSVLITRDCSWNKSRRNCVNILLRKD